MFFVIGILGILGFTMFAMATGGSIAAFIDIPSLAIVFGGSFFSALAMSRGKLNHHTVSFFGDSALTIGWIGFLIGLILMLRGTELTTKDGLDIFLSKASPVALLPILYGVFLKLVCSAWVARSSQ